MNKYFLCLAIFGSALSAQAQQPTVTAKDYERAESFLSVDPTLIQHNGIHPNWMGDDRFWYRTGSQFTVYNPAKAKGEPAFNQEKLAAALSATSGKSYTAADLPFQAIAFSPDYKGVIFHVDGKQWKFDTKTNQVTPDTSHVVLAAAGGGGGGRGRRGGGAARGGNPNEVLSPDGKKAAFIKDFNLWVRNTKTNAQTQLTTDGVKNDGYATDNAGWAGSDKAVLVWSPDSKKIATFQQDERDVSDMYLVNTQIGAPKLTAWKSPLPGDKVIPMLRRVIINVENPKVIALNIPADPHRSTLSDDIKGGLGWADVYWSDDATKLVFASTNRDHKTEKVRMADANTGAVRELFEETVKTQFESGWADVTGAT
jgi:hypothetical protein